MNLVTIGRSVGIMLSAILVYVLAALIGVISQSTDQGSVDGIMLSYAAITLYKLGHLPLAVAVSPLTSWAICWATSCEFDNAKRDTVAHIVAGVVFLGLCLAK